jgi:hypothetical protein
MLRQEMDRIVRSPAFHEKLGNLGVIPAIIARGSFSDFNQYEIQKWGKAVRDSGATLD